MKAPESIPFELLEKYTMDGAVPLEYKYANDCSDEVQALINQGFTEKEFQRYLSMVSKRENNYYGPTDQWLYDALTKYPIEGKDICIIGSANPWYEAIAVSFGVKSCTVIEYSKRKSFHESIVYLQPHEITEGNFDACFSISSVEHDGLGRYGDPLDPDGDLKAMKSLRGFLKDDALVYLAVPVGLDKIVFNVHRVYGEKRLPKILEGWQEVDRFGFFEQSYTNNVNGVNGTPYQPIQVLKKK
tara:strand:- start:11943 stop:12671 length:729 start_codon:yes stop_codon:yes gene_type:complete